MNTLWCRKSNKVLNKATERSKLPAYQSLKLTTWYCNPILKVEFRNSRYYRQKWKSLSRVWLFVTPQTYIVCGILQARILEWVAFPFSRGSSQPRGWTEVSCIAGRFFTKLSHKGSPGITNVGSLSLLQWIFQTQESNWGLLHCRRIFDQLSYQGGPLQAWMI